MRPTIHRIDRVGEGKYILGIAVVVLDRNFHVHRLALAFHIDRRIVDGLFALVQVANKFSHTAAKTKFRLLIAALIFERDLEPFIQEGEFAQALSHGVKAECRRGKNRGVRMKRDFRTGLARLTSNLQFGFGLAFLIFLLPHFAITPDFQMERIRKRIDDRNPHAVQAAGNLVSIAIEFATGVQHGHHHLGRGFLLGGVHIRGNSPAVVGDSDGIAFMNDHVDLVAKTGHRFVNGVVYHLPDKVMQTGFGC